MNDKKFYVDENGIEWRRVYTVPQACVDSDFDPRNKDEFIRRGAKYGTLGDLMDKSRELSEKRAAKDGIDQVKETWLNNYEKSRNGKKHPSRLPKVVETPHIKIDMSN